MVPLFEPLAPLVAALGPGNLWAVGGAVRRVIEGQPLADIDVDLATPLPPEAVEAKLRAAGLPFSTQGKAFGCLKVTVNGVAYELTSFRQDTYSQGSRYPKVTFGCPLETDALRRDFTFNAIYMAPDGTVADPVGGIADLKAGVVRFIGSPEARLAEDPLRAVRLARFCAAYGTAGLVPEVVQAVNAALPAVLALNPARVAAEKAKGQNAPHLAEVRARLAEGVL